MSLVGSEVDVSIQHDSLPRKRAVSDDEGSVTEISSSDQHPPVTPPRSAEMLFFSGLDTQNISAAALAQQIHMTHRSSNWTGTSVATDDFATALGWTSSGDDLSMSATPRALISNRSSDFSNAFTDDDSDNDSDTNIFQKDVLSRNYSIPEHEETFQESNMATATSTYSTMKKNATPEKKFVTAEAPTHVDAAEKVYDTAKGIWAWGKGVAVFSPFLGIAEGAAGKAVSLAGHSLEGLDGSVVDTLHGLDDSVLNPAITAIVGALLHAASQSEDVLKPVIVAILKPLGLIKDTAENPELTTVSGVTVR